MFKKFVDIIISERIINYFDKEIIVLYSNFDFDIDIIFQLIKGNLSNISVNVNLKVFLMTNILRNIDHFGTLFIIVFY